MDLKQEAFNEIKRVIELGDLDISDQEIIKLVDDLSKPKGQIVGESITRILNEIGVFTSNKNTSKVFNELSDKWSEIGK